MTAGAGTTDFFPKVIANKKSIFSKNIIMSRQSSTSVNIEYLMSQPFPAVPCQWIRVKTQII